MHNPNSFFQSGKMKRFVCVTPANSLPLLPFHCSTPTPGKASHPAPDIQSSLSSFVTCFAPGNNIAQALGRYSSLSQASLRDVCVVGWCQSLLTLARCGSQQDCPRGGGSAVSSRWALSSPSQPPPFPLKEALSHPDFRETVFRENACER